jgi:hypothetical protein
MNLLAKYREKRDWRRVSRELAGLNRRLAVAGARQIIRESQQLRLGISGPKATGELRKSIALHEARMLEAWHKYFQVPSITSPTVDKAKMREQWNKKGLALSISCDAFEFEPFTIPPPHLSYAFKFPSYYESEDWKAAVDSVACDRESALYAIYTLELKLRDKNSGLSRIDKQHIREAIRVLSKSAKTFQTEEKSQSEQELEMISGQRPF